MIPHVAITYSSPLNNLYQGSMVLKQKKEKKKHGFPMKDFGNDRDEGLALITPRKTKTQKTKEKKKITRGKASSVVTPNGSIRVHKYKPKKSR